MCSGEVCGFPEIFTIIAHQAHVEWNKPEKEHIAENSEGTLGITFITKTGLQFVHCIVKNDILWMNSFLPVSPYTATTQK